MYIIGRGGFFIIYLGELIDEILIDFYKEIEKYFENIISAPSSINSIIKYYKVGVVDGEYNKRYILFNDIIVKEYEIKVGIKDGGL